MLFHIYICFFIVIFVLIWCPGQNSVMLWMKLVMSSMGPVETWPSRLKKRGTVSVKFLPLLFTKNSAVETCLIDILCGLCILTLLENVINHHFSPVPILSSKAAKFSISPKCSCSANFIRYASAVIWLGTAKNPRYISPQAEKAARMVKLLQSKKVQVETPQVHMTVSREIVIEIVEMPFHMNRLDSQSHCPQKPVAKFTDHRQSTALKY